MSNLLEPYASMKPYVREYGGGDDRWCWHRKMFTDRFWNILCDGHGRDFEFAEYSTPEQAKKALLKAAKLYLGIDA